MLTTSSSRKRMPQKSSAYAHVQGYELVVDYDQLMLEEISTMESYQQHMCAYLALCIEKQFMQSINRNQYKCFECLNVLHGTHERINDDLLAMKNDDGPAKQPFASTLKIVIFSDAVMKSISAQSTEGNHFEAVRKTIYNNLDINDLYTSVDFHHVEGTNIVDHKDNFILEVLIYSLVVYFMLKTI